MPTVTWIGSHLHSNIIITQFQRDWEINKPVEIEDKDILERTWRNEFYVVEGWSPKGENSEDQPRRGEIRPSRMPVANRVLEHENSTEVDTDSDLKPITEDGSVVERDLPKVIANADQAHDEDPEQPSSQRSRRRGRRNSEGQ